MLINGQFTHCLWNRTGAEGSAHARWETNTWPVLEDLAQNHPEAGIHFQSKNAQNTSKTLAILIYKYRVGCNKSKEGCKFFYRTMVQRATPS